VNDALQAANLGMVCEGQALLVFHHRNGCGCLCCGHGGAARALSSAQAARSMSAKIRRRPVMLMMVLPMARVFAQASDMTAERLIRVVEVMEVFLALAFLNTHLMYDHTPNVSTHGVY